MHKDEIEGAGKEVRGNIKAGIGKMTGDKKLQADGELDKAEGRVQREVGKVKEKAQEALDN